MKYLLVITMLVFFVSCKDKPVVQEKAKTKTALVKKPVIPIVKKDNKKPKKVSTDSNKKETKKK